LVTVFLAGAVFLTAVFLTAGFGFAGVLAVFSSLTPASLAWAASVAFARAALFL